MSFQDIFWVHETFFPDLNNKPITDINGCILQELGKAKTETCLGTYHGKVTPDYIGHHKWFTFRRHNNSWLAEGDIDEKFALKIYNESSVNKYICPNGYANHPHPKVIGKITHYHIYTQEAFNRFIEIIDQY